MGKFDGVLMASDFDNTMAYTEGALRAGTPIPPLSAENRGAILYFMEEGGTFSVVTGRSLPSFDQVRSDIPMNGPTVLFNGAAIYDFAQSKYLYTAFLPETIRSHVTEILEALGPLTFKIYHDDNSMYVVNPNAVSAQRQHLTHEPARVLSSILQAPSPILKVAFEEELEVQQRILDFMDTRPWRSGYEVVSSSNHLLEVTVHGADKGGMVQKLTELLHISPRHVYAVGDHANDIPMLRLARQAFAPSNAIEAVRSLPGIRVLPHCRDNAIAAMVRALDAMY